jgi:hypothetical protein
VDSNQLVSVQILNPPQSDLVQIDTFFPNSDGSFSRIYKTEGSRWNLDGVYTIKLIYNGEKLQTSFEFIRDSTPEPTPDPTPEPPPDPTPEPETNSIHNSIIINHEPKTHIPGFPSLNKSPQYYFDRYNNESSYKLWFDSQFPNESIYRVLGFPDPISIPDWIKNNASWWATGKIDDKEFISGIQFMIKNNILIIPNLPDSQTSDDKDIPTWVRNNASWWALNKISEEEFVSGIKYLIQQGIISV